jgi:hypothetical protein
MPAKAEIQPTSDCSSQLEVKLRAKEPRLPRRIAAYIRRLKQEERFDEAIKYRERIISQKKVRSERDHSATEELHKTIAEVICTDDPVAEAAGEIKITWLFYAVEEIETTNQRNVEILEILSSTPSEFQPRVEQLMPGIRDEVAKFMPKPPIRPLAV